MGRVGRARSAESPEGDVRPASVYSRLDVASSEASRPYREGLQVIHIHNDNRVLAFQRWLPDVGRDVMVVVSLNENTFYDHPTELVSHPEVSGTRFLTAMSTTRGWTPSSGKRRWRRRGRPCLGPDADLRRNHASSHQHRGFCQRLGPFLNSNGLRGDTHEGSSRHIHIVLMANSLPRPSPHLLIDNRAVAPTFRYVPGGSGQENRMVLLRAMEFLGN